MKAKNLSESVIFQEINKSGFKVVLRIQHNRRLGFKSLKVMMLHDDSSMMLLNMGVESQTVMER